MHSSEYIGLGPVKQTFLSEKLSLFSYPSI